MSLFSELKSRVKDWNIDDEDSLIRKVKLLSENYLAKTNELSSNLNNLEKQCQKVEVSYHNSLNMLKNMSIKKFVEHSISNDSMEVKKKSITSTINQNLISKEEKESALYLKFKNAISISLDKLNIKDIIDLKDGKDVIDDDSVSVTSTKNFSNMNNFTQSGIKLPTIIGQEVFFKSPYLGINVDSQPIQNQNSLVAPNPNAQTIQINIPISPNQNASYTIPNNPNSNVPIYIDIPQNPNDLPQPILQKDRNIDDDNRSVRSTKSTNSTRNIGGRASVVVSSKDPTKVIFNNDAAKGNIPKVPNIPFPIPRKSIKKKPDTLDNKDSAKPFESQPTQAPKAQPKLTQKEELMRKFNNKNQPALTNSSQNQPSVIQNQPQIAPQKVEPQQSQNSQPNKKYETSQTINTQKPPPAILENLINSNKFKNNNEDDDEDGGKLFSTQPLKTALTQQFNQTQAAAAPDKSNTKQRNSLFNIDEEEPIILKKQSNNFPQQANNNADPIALTNFLNRKDTVLPPKLGLKEEANEEVKQNDGLRSKL